LDDGTSRILVSSLSELRASQSESSQRVQRKTCIHVR